MKRISILLFVLFTTIHAQNISIKINGLKNGGAALFSIELAKSSFVESIYSDSNGLFRISNNGQFYEGFYRLIFSDNVWFNFIYDGENIEIEANKNNILKTLTINKSLSNIQYFKYLRISSEYKNERNKFLQALNKYKNDNPDLIMIKNKFRNVQNQYRSFIDDFSRGENESFIARYILSAREPIINLNSNSNKIIEFLIKHFWDNVDFDDIRLLHSDLFINKTIEYLNYLSGSQKDRSFLTKQYKKAVDIILNRAKTNELVYQQMTEYLTKGFKKLGFNNVIDYIVDNYIITDNLCLDSDMGNFIEMRINQAKIFAKNVKVPDIELPDLQGKIINLYDVAADKTLILFYSSHCPHCQEFLPKLLEFYLQNKNKFEIFGVSLDTNPQEWKNFVKNNNYNWINVSDLKGWESKVSYDFYIYATPTMFLVDKNFKIINRPNNLDELKTALE
ncbi:MAG: redoxin domain-containing protein [Chlorobi bacterium]|nr:redoxin domain-containing protein [Chlorobiota bacterium]